jgi:hypothetical protein
LTSYHKTIILSSGCRNVFAFLSAIFYNFSIGEFHQSSGVPKLKSLLNLSVLVLLIAVTHLAKNAIAKKTYCKFLSGGV